MTLFLHSCFLKDIFLVLIVVCWGWNLWRTQLVVWCHQRIWSILGMVLMTDRSSFGQKSRNWAMDFFGWEWRHSSLWVHCDCSVHACGQRWLWDFLFERCSDSVVRILSREIYLMWDIIWWRRLVQVQVFVWSRWFVWWTRTVFIWVWIQIFLFLLWKVNVIYSILSFWRWYCCYFIRVPWWWVYIIMKSI